MKSVKFNLFVFGLLIVFSMRCYGQQHVLADTAMYYKLIKMNFKGYKNKEVRLFLADFGYDYKKVIPTSKKPGYISHVIFRFSDSLSIDIAVKDLSQKEPINFNYKFDIVDFKTKKINWLCFRYAGKCIKGCEKTDCN